MRRKEVQLVFARKDGTPSTLDNLGEMYLVAKDAPNLGDDVFYDGVIWTFDGWYDAITANLRSKFVFNPAVPRKRQCSKHNCKKVIARPDQIGLIRYDDGGAIGKFGASDVNEIFVGNSGKCWILIQEQSGVTEKAFAESERPVMIDGMVVIECEQAVTNRAQSNRPMLERSITSKGVIRAVSLSDRPKSGDMVVGHPAPEPFIVLPEDAGSLAYVCISTTDNRISLRVAIHELAKLIVEFSAFGGEERQTLDLAPDQWSYVLRNNMVNSSVVFEDKGGKAVIVIGKRLLTDEELYDIGEASYNFRIQQEKGKTDMSFREWFKSKFLYNHG